MKCFVIMPFSETTHTKEEKETKINAEQWTFIFNNWIKKAVESYPSYKIECKRSSATPGYFVKGIVKDIYDSAIAIADLTGRLRVISHSS